MVYGFLRHVYPKASQVIVGVCFQSPAERLFGSHKSNLPLRVSWSATCLKESERDPVQVISELRDLLWRSDSQATNLAVTWARYSTYLPPLASPTLPPNTLPAILVSMHDTD